MVSKITRDEISDLTDEVTRQRAITATDNVVIPSWGEIYRQPDGGWHHCEGGYFGAQTSLAKRCEVALVRKGEIFEECWQMIASSLRVSSNLIPNEPWHKITLDFAHANCGVKDHHGLKEEFQQVIEETLKTLKLVEFYNAALQRHHDYFIRLHREGKLPSEEQINYDLAMEREEAGEVNPLPEED